jgi:hypothetical protein
MGASQSWGHAFLPMLRAAYWCGILCLAFLALVYFCRTSGVGGHGPAKIARILTGTADRPYAFRVLLPTVANILAPILDSHLALRIGIKSEIALGAGFFQSTLNGSTYPSQVVLILAMMYLSLAGFAVAMRHLIGRLGYSAVIQYVAPPLLLAGTTIFMRFGYIYDFTTLFLFSLSLLMMSLQRWMAYLLVFALATLNKETSIFLVLIFVLYFFSRLSRRESFLLTILQLGLYGLLQGVIRIVYRNNPGTPVQWHLASQFEALKQSATHLSSGLVLTSACVVAIIAMVIYGWSMKPRLLRAAIWILPCFLVLYTAWGYPGEIRAMLEVYPILALLIVPPQLLLGSKELHAAE